MTENEPTERSYTLEGRITDRFPVLEQTLDEETLKAEVKKLAEIMRLYITTEQTLNSDWQGWGHLEEYFISQRTYVNKKREAISPWIAAASDLRERHPELKGKSFPIVTGMQDVFLAEKGGVTIELFKQRRSRSKRPNQGLSGKLVGRGEKSAHVLSAKLTNRGR